MVQDRTSAIARRQDDVRSAKPWRSRVLIALAIVLLGLAGLILLFTDRSPLVPPSPPPTAEQAGAARAAVRQFRVGQARAGNSMVRFDAAELSAIGALASNGFRPDRLLVAVRGRAIHVLGSHRLPLGRWLNVSVVSGGGGAGFPPARLTVGSMTFPRSISRLVFDAAHAVVVARGGRLPPLDRLVRNVRVGQDFVTATVSLPPGSGIMAQLGDDAQPAPGVVRDAYCRLVRLQAADPSNEFAAHVRRAFGAAPGVTATSESNRAAILALGMLTVDPRVGELAGVKPALVARCRIAPIDVRLNGRADLPKHWALSAALAVATGTQFSQAMGEWKELADGISRQSRFAVGDPSGFSFLDLAADRSGFLTAGLAMEPGSAVKLATALARAGSGDLLPPTLMPLQDGIPNATFVRQYGSTEDPRFLAALDRIDAELRRSAQARSGPLASLPPP